jgi:hypothetical protein
MKRMDIKFLPIHDEAMTPSYRSWHSFGLISFSCICLLVISGCGYRFGNGPAKSPFPLELKTIELRSAINNTAITGIEAELTNGLREEFALGSRLRQVRSGGHVILFTIISNYQDNPVTYKADGKELTRVGVLQVKCRLERSDSKQPLWSEDLSATRTYLVAETASGTLSNRRKAITLMIKDLVVRVSRALYDSF